MDKITQDALAYFKEHDPNHYRFLLTNNYERAVFLKGDPVYPREATRYLWANRNLLGKNILEIGCSTGYGSQFLPNDANYIGLDYDHLIIGVAREQEWGLNTSFTNADTDQPMFAGGMDGGSNLLKSCVGTMRITNYESTTKLKYYQAQYAQDTNLDYVIVLHGIFNSTSAITSLNWTRSTGSGTFSNETNTSILLYGVS